ncbi:MAG: amidohydrolase family protein [Acidimicrobiia bacterium]|jgi:cytosine/adenosine deaminase-related metal-dependent hydrolase
MSSDPTPKGPTPVDLIVAGGTCLTLDTDRRILTDSAIVVDAGRIVAIGSQRGLERDYLPSARVDATGCVVTPGYVDAHIHLSQHLGRSSIPDIWPEHREHDHWLPYWLTMTEEDSYLSALLACMEMARNGTTTFCDMSGRFSAEIQAKAADAVGLRGLVSEICWDVPPHPEVAIGDTDACLERLERVVAAFPRTEESRVWAGVAMSGMGKASDRLIVEGKRLAERHGIVLYMHQSFAESDTQAFLRRTNGRLAVHHLDDLGILGPDVHLVHMIHTDAAEIPVLAETHTNVVHCPGASVRWGLGVSRTGAVPEMLAAGVNVALGSDSGNYADAFDIGKQAYLAATIHREARGGTPVISAEAALEMATLNGARAVGAEDRIGSLEPGKRADLVIHGADRPEWHPSLDPVTTLLYAAQSSGVRDVIVDGRVILRDGRLTQIDEQDAYGQIDAAARSLADRMGFVVPHRWPVH